MKASLIMIRISKKFFLFELRLWLLIGFSSMGNFSFAGTENVRKPEFFIVDSYVIGWFTGLCTGKGQRWKCANELAGRKAKQDVKIWGGLFITDSNKTFTRKTGELFSRFLYETPQTLGGFMTAQFYNTYTKRVNSVEYELGSTVLNMNVNWPGVSLGSYILADERIKATPFNKLYQHEYGHYLQSQRMGWAYLIRVGLPAIMSKGDHDKHPVEVSCNAEACLYFHQYFPNFEENGNYTDTIGWNYRFNPFPDTIGEPFRYRGDTLQSIDFNNPTHIQQLNSLIVRPTFLDYFSWIAFPSPFFVGVYNSRRYNKAQAKEQGFELK